MTGSSVRDRYCEGISGDESVQILQAAAKCLSVIDPL